MLTIRIETQQFTADQKLLDLIDKNLRKLEDRYQRLTDITVFMKLETKRHNIKDKVVEIRANLPGNQVFSSQVDKRFESAFKASFEKIKRQLRDTKKR